MTFRLRRIRPAPGWALPGAAGPRFHGKLAIPMLLFPIPKSRLCRRPGAVTTSLHSVSEGNFRPQPRWPPGPAPPGLNPRGPRFPREPSRPFPGWGRFPLTWPAVCQARGLRESYCHPLRGPFPFCAGTVILPWVEAPSLISSAPELARGVAPLTRAMRGFHRGEEGGVLPEPVTRFGWSSDDSNNSCLRRLSFDYGFAKCFHPQ